MSNTTQPIRLDPAEAYEAYFVPAIGLPVAEDLVVGAALRPGERVLDVACGTGVVARLAAKRVGESGSVAGADINAAMLAVARSQSPNSIDWYETAAEAMPLSDGSFDVVLCQMGLQFFSDKLAAAREMRRVLTPGGRILVNVPGPIPEPLQALADGLAEHIAPQAASFVHVVFCLHGIDPLREILNRAGFTEVDASIVQKPLRLPPAADFLWQYVSSTPLAPLVARATEQQRAALERDVCRHWHGISSDGGMTLDVGITTAKGFMR